MWVGYFLKIVVYWCLTVTVVMLDAMTEDEARADTAEIVEHWRILSEYPGLLNEESLYRFMWVHNNLTDDGIWKPGFTNTRQCRKWWR